MLSGPPGSRRRSRTATWPSVSLSWAWTWPGEATGSRRPSRGFRQPDAPTHSRTRSAGRGRGQVIYSTDRLNTRVPEGQSWGNVRGLWLELRIWWDLPLVVTQPLSGWVKLFLLLCMTFGKETLAVDAPFSFLTHLQLVQETELSAGKSFRTSSACKVQEMRRLFYYWINSNSCSTFQICKTADFQPQF